VVTPKTPTLLRFKQKEARIRMPISPESNGRNGFAKPSGVLRILQPLPADAVGPTLEEERRLASERVLNDVTLERGDIVVTNKGSFVFSGSTTEPRKPTDFVPLAAPVVSGTSDY